MCGEPDRDYGIKRTCHTCVVAKCTAKDSKRKSTGMPAGSGNTFTKRTKKVGDKSAPRLRLTVDQKKKILKLLDNHVAQGQIAACFEKDGSDDEGAERGAGPPAVYGGLLSHFGVLEKAAAGSGNGDAAFHLKRANVTMIAAHASKPTREADMREDS